MSHYFESDPTLASNRKSIDFVVKNTKIMVVSDKGTFSKYRVDLGTSIFIETLISLPLKGDILDLGSGNGIVGIAIKKIFDGEVNVDFSDVNTRCIELTKEGLSLNSLTGEVYLSDGFNNIDKTYDYVLLNSPISTGKATCYRLYKESYEHLNQNGKLIVVINKDKGALSHKKELESYYSNVEIINKQKGYFIIVSSK